jgi:hypothetical protein
MRTWFPAMITVAAFAVGFAAYAGEGDGPNFPGLLQPHAVVANPTISQTGSEGYPAAVSTVVNPVVAGNVLQPNGGEAIVQTANSAPPGFANGTPAFRYAQSVNRYWASRPAIG